MEGEKQNEKFDKRISGELRGRIKIREAEKGDLDILNSILNKKRENW